MTPTPSPPPLPPIWPDPAVPWPARRRQIVDDFARLMYGRAPAAPTDPLPEVWHERAAPFLGGAARRWQWEICLAPEHRLRCMLVLPASPPAHRRPVPVFAGLNFYGNHTLHPDPAIRLAEGWVRPGLKPVLGGDLRHADEHRGVAHDRWPLADIVAAGCGTATAYYCDVEPDTADGWSRGWRGELIRQGRCAAPGEWGAIGAWAWALQRMLDSLLRLPEIDPARVGAMGHSRLGKVALWAAAQDERFAFCWPNDSGCCGAALGRREQGERFADITANFPHWFCDAFKPFAGREQDFPLDQHQLIAAVAPRPFYLSSATDDAWADPPGEYASLRLAAPTWPHTPPLPPDMPPPDAPHRWGQVGHHLRPGRHALTSVDWRHALRFVRETLADGA